MKKLMNHTLAAAGFAAILLTGACATTHDDVAAGPKDDNLVQVTQSESVVPAPGPALVDSDGNIYSSSAAPGSGNASTVGTNTNVNSVPQPSTVEITEVTPAPLVTETTVITTPAPVTTTTTIETTTVPVPMTSSVEETNDDEPEPARTRLRKD
jgi:hypothetical protein